MQILTALLAGLIFGAGLVLSGMANPAVILGFLDFAGTWNPTLLFVVVGALAVVIPGYKWLKDRTTVFAEDQKLPVESGIDIALIAGSILFGVGWGLAGLCPGPALAMFGIQPGTALVFVASMTVGMALTRTVYRFIIRVRA